MIEESKLKEMADLAAYWREEGQFQDIAAAVKDESTEGYAIAANETANTLITLLTELRRLQADNAGLMKALEPFAEAAFTVADLRAARTALEKQI